MSTIIRLKRGGTSEELMVLEPTNEIVGQPLLRFVEGKPSYIYTFDERIDDTRFFTRFGSDIIAGSGVMINTDGEPYSDNGISYVVSFRKINVNLTSPLYINSSNQIAINVGPGLGIINNQLVANGSSYEEGLNIEIDNDDKIHSFRFIPAYLSNPAPQFSDGSYNLIGSNGNYGITPTFDKVSTYMALKPISHIETNNLTINLFDNLNDDSLIQEGVIHHINIFNASPEEFPINLRSVTTDPNFKMIDITNNSTHAIVDNTVSASGKTFHFIRLISRCIPNTMAELSFIKYRDADGNQIISITHTYGSGTSLWTAIAGTRASNTTITVAGDQTAIFKKGMIVRWLESSVIKWGMVSIPSTYSSPNTTITIIGCTCASIDTDSFKYSSIIGVEQFQKNFAVAGTIGATGSNVANAYYATEPMYVFGSDLQVGTAGTTNSTTIDINKGGTTMFTVKPTLATTVAASTTPFTADTATSLALNDKVTIDIDEIQTTAAIDLYVQLYVVPQRYFSLT